MLIYRFGNWKPKQIPIDEIFKATLIVLEIGIMEPRAQILGGVGIFDLQGELSVAFAVIVTNFILSQACR